MRPFPISLLLFALLLAALPAGAAAAPTCAEGPETVGATIVGTPCADTIHAPRGITTVEGEGGDDALFGGRGNDQLNGGEGDDRLYGGIGDDRLRGGVGQDRLSGGFGADSLDGEAGGDFARGDATIDAIFDTGPGGETDILSYATGATPGFTNDEPDHAGFPGGAEGRGVFIDLFDPGAEDGNGFANNGLAPVGGGVDLELDGTSFETVIGTAFPDFIVGSPDAETIYGGGGADVIVGEGGADALHGGAEGDSCSGAGASIDCEGSGNTVDPRDPTAIAVGLMAPTGVGPPALYLTGSTGADRVAVSYSASPTPRVSFELLAGSAGGFDTDSAAGEGCGAPAAGKVLCLLPAEPDSLLLAGLGANDVLSADGLPESTSLVLLGGPGEDNLAGDPTEDALVDGPGADVAAAGAGDDALPNNEGADDLDAGPGDDLFVSNAICDGDSLNGGDGRDNANWANFNQAVTIDMGARAAGRVGPQGQAECPSAALLTELVAIEDVEGSGGDDILVGDSADNQLLGRTGHDSYFAEAGNDLILANSADQDLTIDCGLGFDTALIDHPQYEDPPPVECESIEARDPNSFRPPDTPPNPEPEPEPPVGEEPPSSPPPPPTQPETPSPPPPGRRQGFDDDVTPPRTRLLHRPAPLLLASGLRRRVVFTFAADEPGARFRCKLDRRPARPCRSPRAYLATPGRHAFRVFAIDAGGNRDSSPALVRFRIRLR
jgi:Ca2+-binding RTX toxin-like protein